MTLPYPLQWPDGFPRKKTPGGSAFKTQLPAAMKNVEDSLRLFGSDSGRAVSGIVISSNVTLGVTAPSDPGVAVWFTWDGEQRCIAVDPRFTSQACSGCGVIVPKPLSQRTHECPDCGLTLDRDHNAAINILHRVVVRPGARKAAGCRIPAPGNIASEGSSGRDSTLLTVEEAG